MPVNCNLQEKLTEHHKLLIEFASFEFQAMQNAMDQFLSKTNLEYDEEHVEILMQMYMDKYIQLQILKSKILKLPS